MATIRKRGDRWQVQIRRQGHPPITRSFSTKADGESWARQTEAQLERSALPLDLRSLDRSSFGDLLRRYEAEITARKRGARFEAYRIRQMLKHPMALLPLSRLSGSTFATYRDQRLRTVSGETVRREMTILHHVIEVARQEWNVPLMENPVALAKRPTPGRSRERRPSPSEIERLLEGAGRSRTKCLKPAIILAMETGMRRGELLSMEWRHVDLERRVVSVPVTKTGEPRVVPLTPKAAEVLGALPVTHERVLPISGDGLRHAWERLCKRVGVHDMHWHDWRHEALSRFFERGLALAEVALISGHRDPRMLFRYTHLRPYELAQKLAGMTWG